MRTFLIFASLLTFTIPVSFAQNQQKALRAKAPAHERLYFRGFSKTGDLNKELTTAEVDQLHRLLGNDSTAVQIRDDFDHPGNELKPLVDKLSKETREILVQSAQFSPGPESCSKKQ
jgi:hypothetical protein